MGMQGVLAKRRENLRGIVNGVDQTSGIRRRTYILANFTAATATRREPQQITRLGPGPWSCTYLRPGLRRGCRLTWQKGIDLSHVVPLSN